MSKYYALLTGSKNNAGDYLIKARAKNLLKEWRNDREFVDIDGWKPLSDEDLEVVNNSAALLLTGGPALNTRMRPIVYGLRENLDDIKVPITFFGVGWRAPDNKWSRTGNFPFTRESRQLLERVERDGLTSSVRDYQSQRVLRASGVYRVVMTGCPALYSPDHRKVPLTGSGPINNVTISLGVHFAGSKTLEIQVKELVERVVEGFPSAKVTVAFHHSLDPDHYIKAYGRETPLFIAQKQFRDWLISKGVAYADISGSADNLIEHYNSADLHIGYRVHAHIMMTSVRKPSVLLSEDARGMSLGEVLGGHIFDAFESYQNGIAKKILRRLGVQVDPYSAASRLPGDIVHGLLDDLDQNWPRAKGAISSIDYHFDTMERFVRDLP